VRARLAQGSLAIKRLVGSADFFGVRSLRIISRLLFPVFAGFLHAQQTPPRFLSFSSIVGGRGLDSATAVAVDSAGYIYIAGWTDSADLPTTSAIQPQKKGSVNAFIAKWQPGGAALMYCTYFGGSGDDQANAIAVDVSGNAYITGTTTSTDFPVTGAAQPRSGGGRDAFLAKFGPTGALLFSTYLGGAGSDAAYGIALDLAGNAYLAGQTTSSNFPVLNAYQAALHGPSDAFIAKFSSMGALLYSTYIGGSRDETATSIAVDSYGSLYITGNTTSTDFPMSNAIQASPGGNQDAFVTKLDPTGRLLAYSTYLGGHSGTVGAPETGAAIVVDANGNAVVAGTTSSNDFPVSQALQANLKGSMDAFVTKLNSSGTITYSTYLGGSSVDYATSIAMDKTGHVYVAGYTISPDFPKGSSDPNMNTGTYTGFVVKLGADGHLLHTTFVGGDGSSTVNALAVRRADVIYIAGQTQALNFPVVNNSSTPTGSLDGFVGMLESQRDFDGNGKPDLILQNVATNESSIWYLGGTRGNVLLAAPIIGAAVSGWHVVASADFNGDRVPDILLQNSSTGAISVWYMGGPKGATVLGSPVFATPLPGWRVVAAADFDGDGSADILLENDQAHLLSVWFMGGTGGTTIAWAPVVASLPANWKVASVADLDGDGTPDLILQNSVSNEVQAWFMAGSRYTLHAVSIVSIGVPVAGWAVVGTADFDGNGCPDLLLENASANAVAIWYLGGDSGTTLLDWPLMAYEAPGWRLVGNR